MTRNAHISAALLQLRTWCTLSAGVVIACALLQVVTFSLARYTDCRWIDIPQPLNGTIIGVKPSTTGFAGSPAAAQLPTMPRSAVRSTTGAPVAAPLQVDANRVRSVFDRNLELATSVVVASGLSSVLALVVCAFLGALVTAGAAIAGMQLASRAAVWSAAMLGVCLPWSGIAGKTMIPGVFCGYDVLTAAADAEGAGAIASHVLLPVAVIALSGCVIAWFREGVAEGVKFVDLTLVDQHLEAEMDLIRERGVTRHNPGGRATGAFKGVLASDEASPTAPRKAAGAERLSGDEVDLSRSMLRPRDPDGKRPI